MKSLIKILLENEPLQTQLTILKREGIEMPKYWINEDGKEKIVGKKLFTYWIKEFCKHITTKQGPTIERPFPAIKDIYCGYNPQGYKICGKLE